MSTTPIPLILPYPNQTPLVPLLNFNPSLPSVDVGTRSIGAGGRYYDTFTNIGTTAITVGQASYEMIVAYSNADLTTLTSQIYLGSETVTLQPGQSATLSSPTSPCGYGTQVDSYVGAPITNFTGSDNYSSRLLFAGYVPGGFFPNSPATPPCPVSPPPTLESGDTATIGYWQNPNGQALIRSLPSGPTAAHPTYISLGNYLATMYPNLYSSLAGKSNDYIANYYVTLFNQEGGPKIYAQILNLAIASYVTDSTLAGNVAAAYGFNVTASGTGSVNFTDTTGGAALLGLNKNASYSIATYLKAADAHAVSGVLTVSDLGTLTALFDSINQKGDIK